jgi:hypothetical protein
LTPREYQALADVWRDSKALEAQAITDYRNVHFREDGAPAWEVAHLFGKRRQTRRLIQTPEEMRATMRAWKGGKAGAAELPEWALRPSKGR